MWHSNPNQTSTYQPYGPPPSLPAEDLRAVAQAISAAVDGKAPVAMSLLPALLKGCDLGQMAEKGRYKNKMGLVKAAGALGLFTVHPDKSSPLQILIGPLDTGVVPGVVASAAPYIPATAPGQKPVLEPGEDPIVFQARLAEWRESQQRVAASEKAAAAAAPAAAASVKAAPAAGPGRQLCCTPGCGVHPKSDFSSSMLHKPTAKRRCKHCILGDPKAAKAQKGLEKAQQGKGVAAGEAAAAPSAVGGPAPGAAAPPQAAASAAAGVPPPWAKLGAKVEAQWGDGWLPCVVSEPGPESAGKIRITWTEDGSMSDMGYDAVRPAA